MTVLGEDHARRLAFIRLLLDRAVESSTHSAPFSFDSINRLHDAAEMFLTLAVQVNGVAVPKEFANYWDVLEPKLGRPLSYRAQMQRFNKLRVNLKHYGVEPSEAEIRNAANVVSAFLSDECEVLFGVALEDVSITGFITCVEARELLEAAEQEWTAGRVVIALGKLADSFTALVEDYEERKMLGSRISVFDSTKDMTSLTPFHRRVTDSNLLTFRHLRSSTIPSPALLGWLTICCASLSSLPRPLALSRSP